MQPAPYNPFQDQSAVAFIVLGIILLVFGIFLCWPVAILGVVLLILGLVWPSIQGRPAMYAPYPAYPAYQPPPYPQYPGAPVAPPGQPVQPGPAPAPPAQVPRCPRCGQPLEYVAQYQRWYCRAENVYPWG